MAPHGSFCHAVAAQRAALARWTALWKCPFITSPPPFSFGHTCTAGGWLAFCDPRAPVRVPEMRCEVAAAALPAAAITYAKR